jgi:hypothetical protein
MGRPVAAAAPSEPVAVPEPEASLARELATEERLEAADPVALSSAEETLAAAELRDMAAESVADEAAEPRLEVTEEASEARLEVMELMAEPMPVGRISETMEETSWALTTPAAKTAVAMVEKRILMVFGLVGWGWLGEVK